MFTRQFLNMRVTPQTDAIIVSMSDDEDDTPTSRVRKRDESSSWACQIRYRDSKGDESERDITCMRLDGYGGATHVHAYCHKRERPRMFKVSNIIEVMDLSTGEVVDPISHFEMLAVSGALPFEDKGFAAFVQIALFMAKCDGSYHPMEEAALEAAITAYAMRFGGDDRMIEKALNRSPAIAPDGRDVLLAVNRLRSSPIGKQATRLILDHSSAIMDADGAHHPSEVAWAIELSEALRG